MQTKMQMRSTLALEKKLKKNKNLFQEILREDVVKLWFLSKPIGNILAVFPAVTPGPFYCRTLRPMHYNSSTVTMMLMCLD